MGMQIPEWLDPWADYFRRQWGLEKGFARQVALFWAYLSSYGLNPRVTSGWRDPQKQAAMRARWDKGDRKGLRARPALSSSHTRTDFDGKPASEAIDIVTSNDQVAASIARQIGIGVGLDFKEPDPGHYYKKADFA